MNRLFDETYASDDCSVVARNIWYGYIELYTDGEYGKDLVLDEKLAQRIEEIVQKDMNEKPDPPPTQICWYLYGSTKTTDAIEDTIRPTLMIRYDGNDFLVRCNFSDHDFAVKIDAIIAFEQNMEARLRQYR